MSATVGILTVVGVALPLVAFNFWMHRREKRRVIESNAERTRLWAKVEKDRIERATWWREETLRRLNDHEAKTKAESDRQKRMQQAGDVLQELAAAMPGKAREADLAMRQRNLDVFAKLHPAWAPSDSSSAHRTGD